MSIPSSRIHLPRSREWKGALARPGVSLIALWLFLFSLPAFAAPVLEGVLNVIWGDPPPSSGAGPVRILTLTENNGTITELQVSDELLRASGGFIAWNGRRVRVVLREPGHELPGFESSPSARQAAALKLLDDGSDHMEAADLTGSHPWVSILCKFANVSAEPKDLAFFQGMYANQPGGLDDYWREASYGKIDIAGSTAVDWVELPRNQNFYVSSPGSGTNAKLEELFDDCTDAADPFIDFSNGGNGGFSGINMMFNANLDCCAWGGARFAVLDGVSKSWRVTWEPPWGYAHSGVIAHEMGHGFGLPHANNWDGDAHPYDSPWDVMSAATSGYSVTDPIYGKLPQHINMYHKTRLGWVAPARLLEVTDGQTVVATIDAASIASTSNYYMARLPLPGSNVFYTVEVRKRVGNYDGNLPGDAVIIHQVVPGRSEPSWSYDAAVPPANFGANEGTMFRVGETFTDEAQGISLTVNSQTTNGFVVTIDRGGVSPNLDFGHGFE